MFTILYSSQFKKDFKTIERRGYPIQQIEDVFEQLVSEKPLPLKMHDHKLKGPWIGFSECHISPDWLLIYKVDIRKKVITMTRTGTHSDLY